MSLPSNWVDRIFDRLTTVYGHAFLGRWSGLDIDAVKADWGRELSGFQQNPDAIRHGLEHLPPDHPPTVLQFAAACRAAPRAAPKALPAPKPDPERVAQALSGLSRGGMRESSGRAWAERLKAEHQGGAKLTPAQIEMYRRALREPMETAE